MLITVPTENGGTKQLSANISHVPFSYSPNGYRAITIVTLTDTTTNRNYTGSAKCAAPDNFNKRIGRRIAVLRAMKEAGLTRPQRVVVGRLLIQGRA